MPHRKIAERNRSNARNLRQRMTDAERRLWYRLRAHRFQDLSFRRQVPIGHYIIDFVCLDARLIIEVDGGQHSANGVDASRDAWLCTQGFSILRFWNNDVLGNLDGVSETIAKAVDHSTPPSLALPRKGGGNTLRRGHP